jgi:hypothetical protein
MVIFIFPVTIGAATTMFGDKLDNVVFGVSFYMRFIGPFDVFLETLKLHPLFGFGIGASDALSDVVWRVYGGIGDFVLENNVNYYELRPDYLISNSFFHFWIDFGLLGGAGLIFSLLGILRSVGIRRPLYVFVGTAVALQTIGGISALWPWYIFFTFALAVRECERHNALSVAATRR